MIGCVKLCRYSMPLATSTAMINLDCKSRILEEKVDGTEMSWLKPALSMSCKTKQNEEYSLQLYLIFDSLKMELQTQPDKWLSTVRNCFTRCQSWYSFSIFRKPEFLIYLGHTKIHENNTQMECSGATEGNHFLVTIDRDLEHELRLDMHKSFLF